eukprot:TRINITY_DN47184_c0_g1_i1.p1 TRINITY_DN47184_c0_g1~~TRINITY_DN47184_c0_g1_i1.p1  ORF type:complete len:305 (+),score=85.60 TRINITY_DN47184_c0_g1_i1:28-915(+)
MRDDEHTTMEVDTVGGKTFKLQRLRAGSTIAKVKAKLSKPLSQHETGNTSADNLVLVGVDGEPLKNELTVREAGLMDGKATIMTSAQYATRGLHRGPHPGRAKSPPNSPSRLPLKSALKRPDTTLTVTIESDLRSTPFVLTDISTRDTFSTILSLLAAQVNIPPQKLAIVVDNKKMDPRMTLAAARISPGSTCLLVEEESPEAEESPARAGDTIDVIVENIKGDQRVVTMRASDHIVKFHRIAEQEWGLPSSNVGVFYKGRSKDITRQHVPLSRGGEPRGRREPSTRRRHDRCDR